MTLPHGVTQTLAVRLPARLTDWQFVLLALLATRAGLFVVGAVAWQLVPVGASFLDVVPGSPWLTMWAQYDAAYYLDIVVRGYSFQPDEFSNAAFFPLYPWLVRLGWSILGGVSAEALVLVGMIVANVALYVALLYLVALVSRDIGASVARRAVLYFLVFPTTVFLSAVYAESVFLATAIASVYHARHGEWYRAGIAGGLAALSRPFGALLVFPLAIEMLRQRPPRRALPSLFLVPAGLAAFFAYLWWQLGDPWAYIRANMTWGRGFAWPLDTLIGYAYQPLVVFGWYHSVVDLAFVAGMAVLAILVWRHLPRSYAAFASIGLLFTTSTAIWISTPRHALALFPLIVLLAIYGERTSFNRTWLVVSVALAVVFAARFFTGYWVA